MTLEPPLIIGSSKTSKLIQTCHGKSVKDLIPVIHPPEDAKWIYQMIETVTARINNFIIIQKQKIRSYITFPPLELSQSENSALNSACGDILQSKIPVYCII